MTERQAMTATAEEQAERRPSANGSNGRVEADTVNPDPSTNGLNGRDDKGRFAPGNTAGFEPGKSGNPGGRPKGQSILAELRELGEANDGQRKQELAELLWRSALEGDFQYVKELLDRLEGKVTTRVEGTGEFRQIVIMLDPDDEPGEGRNAGAFNPEDDTDPGAAGERTGP